MNVGQDTTLSDSHTSKELAQLLVIADSQLDVAGDDTGFLVVTSSIASQFEDFSGQVLENGSHVHGSTGTDALCT